MSRRSRLALATAALSVAAFLLGMLRVGLAPDPSPLGPARTVVVVGVPGLTWDDVSSRTTPALRRLADDASLGALTTRAASPLTCAWDGWVTLGAGNRALHSPAEVCTAQSGDPPPAPGGLLAPVFAVNDNQPFGAEPGLLGTSVACTTVVGSDAALAVARAKAAVQPAAPPGTPAGWQTVLSACPLTLVSSYSVDPPDRREDLARLDLAVADLAAAIARDRRALLLVVGVSETGTETSRLHVALAVGAGQPAGRLLSASTGRSSYVQLIDVAPTVLSVLGGDQPAAMSGQPMTALTSAEQATKVIADLRERDAAATAHRQLSAALPWLLLGLQALVCAAAILLLPGGRTRPLTPTRRRWLTVAALAVAALPAGTFLADLVPWWRAEPRWLVLLICVLVGTALVTTVALGGPWRGSRLGPALAVAGSTAGLIGLDLVLGAQLQLDSPLGYDAVVAGRFAGLGNLPFGVYAASALLCLAALLHRQPPLVGRVVAVAVGVVVVALVGTPGIGADFGGVLALAPAVTVAGLLIRSGGGPLTTRQLFVAAASGVGLVALIAVADSMRPAITQTHLGRFVGQVLDGTAWTVVARKAEANLHVLSTSPLTLLVPVFGLTLWWLLHRKQDPGRELLTAYQPTMGAALTGIGVAAVLGSLANDSGIAVFAAAGSLTVPLFLAVVASTRPASTNAVGSGHGSTVGRRD